MDPAKEERIFSFDPAGRAGDRALAAGCAGAQGEENVTESPGEAGEGDIRSLSPRAAPL
jgi:hypothetical protein